MTVTVCSQSQSQSHAASRVLVLTVLLDSNLLNLITSSVVFAYEPESEPESRMCVHNRDDASNK